MHDPEEDVDHGGGGRYTEIDPPSRLAFTWTWEDDIDQVEQMIEIDFTESGGETTDPTSSTATSGTRRRSPATKAAGARCSST